jgi:uncharacterized protein
VVFVIFKIINNNIMNSVVHFELPVEDHQRAANFYSKAFDWKLNHMGPEMGNYTVAHTGETDENNMVTQPGYINGGFFTKTAENATPGFVIAVDDIHAAMKQVEAAGGTVVGGASGPGQIDDIPGVGQYISILDTEGNRVALLQPNSRTAA